MIKRFMLPRVRSPRIVNLLPDDASFFIITGSNSAHVIFPMSKATPENKERAIAAIKAIDAGD